VLRAPFNPRFDIVVATSRALKVPLLPRMVLLRVCAYPPRHIRHIRSPLAGNTRYEHTHEPPLSSIRPSDEVTTPHSAYTLGGCRYFQAFMRGRRSSDLKVSVTVTLICLRRSRDPLQGRGFDVLVVHRPDPLPY
jgi:hypothetical protein